MNNIKEVKAINLVSKTRTTTVSTDGLVEVERLRTQVNSPSKKFHLEVLSRNIHSKNFYLKSAI